MSGRPEIYRPSPNVVSLPIAQATPREFPCIPVKPLSRLLAGNSCCEWEVWVQSHYEITKRRFGLGKIIAAHDALLRETVDDLRENEYEFWIERANDFTVKGRVASLKGRPDIIALRDDDAIIIDFKTGRPCMADRVQVMLYMWCVPRAQNLPRFKGIKFRGMLIYEDKDESWQVIEQEAITSQFIIGDVVPLIRKLAGKDEPPKAPSFSNCRFCPVLDEVCDQRLTTGPLRPDAMRYIDMF